MIRRSCDHEARSCDQLAVQVAEGEIGQQLVEQGKPEHRYIGNTHREGIYTPPYSLITSAPVIITDSLPGKPDRVVLQDGKLEATPIDSTHPYTILLHNQ